MQTQKKHKHKVNKKLQQVKANLNGAQTKYKNVNGRCESLKRIRYLERRWKQKYAPSK